MTQSSMIQFSMTQFLSGAGNWPPRGILAARKEMGLWQYTHFQRLRSGNGALQAAQSVRLRLHAVVCPFYPRL